MKPHLPTALLQVILGTIGFATTIASGALYAEEGEPEISGVATSPGADEENFDDESEPLIADDGGAGGLVGINTDSLLLPVMDGIQPMTVAAYTPGEASVYSLSSGVLTIVDGNAAIRMNNASDTTNSSTNYSREDSGNSKITYSSNNGRYSSGAALNSKTIRRIEIQGNGALYLYNRGTGDDFRGTINISATTESKKAVIGTYNTTAADLQIGALTGSGYLLFRGHNTSGTSSFTITDASFDGTVYMTANGGSVQVNATDTGWQNTVFDFTRNADFSDSLIDSTGSAPKGQTLRLTGNATVKGLSNGVKDYAHVSTGSGTYTLTLGTNGTDYSYSGGLQDDSSSGTLGLIKVGSNKQSFTQDAALGSIIVRDGVLEFNGGFLESSSLALEGGMLNTLSGSYFDLAELHGGDVWTMGGANTVSGTITMGDLQGGAMVNLVGSGAGVEFNGPMSLNLKESGATSSSAWFKLENLTFNVNNDLTISGVSVGDSSTVLTLAQLGSGAAVTQSGKITVSALDGSEYIGTLRTEGSYVYIDLKPDVWPPLIDPAVGFIWSGESTGTSFSDHRTLQMGSVWRADGVNTNTGWHEQSVGKGAGVYVNGNMVTFGDTNYHGDVVEAAGRRVEITGIVAPGTIYVTADDELGLVSNNGDARMHYGYAFFSTNESGGMADFVQADGTVVPTKIVKDGKALLVLNASGSFSGGVEVNQGGLYLATPGAAGTGTLTMHTDHEWVYQTWNNATNSFDQVQKVGAELMVCYLHSGEHASAFRSGTITNDIALVDNDPSKAGFFTVSFATSGFNLTSSGDDHANVPRHWRNLTLSGALTGNGSKQDKLVLVGYSSTWSNYRDQSYVTAFTLNEATKSSAEVISNFNGSVLLKNTINTSPLTSNRLSSRTAGAVQVMLSGDKLAYAHIDLTRESVYGAPNETSSDPRQTYNNILVLNGDVRLRGISADFLNSGYYYKWDGRTAENADNGGDRSFLTHTPNADGLSLEQYEEVWHVRTVTNSISTLRLGDYEDDAAARYVYSGAMGYAQSYVENTQAAVMWGDGFDASPASSTDGYITKSGEHSMGLETLSLMKVSSSAQYIHTALLQDVTLSGGTLGFNNLNLKGNLTLSGGTMLQLGSFAADVVGWDAIAEDAVSDLLSVDLQPYETVPTSQLVSVGEDKMLTIITPTPGAGQTEPSTAYLQGDLELQVGATLNFVVNDVVPSESKSHVLLDIAGTFSMVNDPNNITISFSGVDFSSVDFSDSIYYLAAADNIVMVDETGSKLDSSSFVDRMITLGYGYFGVLDTMDSSASAGSAWNASGDGRDYLIMQVTGDPRRTWSGMLGGSYVWAHAESIPASEYDYRWKENTAFQNGQVVLFGNLYQPEEWTDTARLLSEATVKVMTDAQHTYSGSGIVEGECYVLNGEEKLLSVDGLSAAVSGFQKVQLDGRVAPLSIILNSDFMVNADGQEYTVEQDATDYYFFGNGYIADATPEELEKKGFDVNWLTTLQKFGSGMAVIATANTYTGGTSIQGGTLVMQNRLALGTGGITVTNGAMLRGDFADDRTAVYWPGYDGAYIGEGMGTSTVANVVNVLKTVTVEGAERLSAQSDAYIANAYDKKMVLTDLNGDLGSVVTLYGSSAAYESHDSKYTYAVFKVLDPSGFYGSIRMDGNLRGASPEADGGRVQMEIMTTDKSTVVVGQADDAQKKDWLNTNIDLSVAYGTERTVLALDAVEIFDDGSAGAYSQEALVNSLNGTGTIRMADGAINSSVVNMSESKNIVLVIKGLKNGDYDGVLGYGEFQRTTEYGSEHREGIPAVGETCHHYGCGDFGSLSVRKEGSGTTQSVYNAWLNELQVAGGTFVVDHALQVKNLISGGGKRVFVGSVSDLNTVYALTVGAGGILSMDTQLFATGSSTTKFDSWANLAAGTVNEGSGAGQVGWVQLQNGATLTAHTDWYTDTQVDISNGSFVTINTHNFTPDPFISSDHESHEDITGEEGNVAHEHFDHFCNSHIIQLLGTINGQNVRLLFNNEQMSPGATAAERGGSDYMGYVAILNHNAMSGSLEVREQTVLQIMNSSSTQSDMAVTVNGNDAAMQVLEVAKTQYISNLTVRNGGALLLGGSEKTSLGSGEGAQRSIDYEAEDIQLSITNRYTGQDGVVTPVHSDLSGSGARIGGTDSVNATASGVHITAHTATTHEVHDTNLRCSLVELKAKTSMSLNDNVLIDSESVVFGSLGMVDMGLPQTIAVTDMQFASIDPQAAAETVTVGTTTTLELTTSGGTIYRAGNTDIYHVTADQLHNVNVDGSGLTIHLTEDDFLYRAFSLGAGYVAIQISGLGEFRFEDSADAFTLNNWVMLDASGVDITSSWVTSSVVSAEAGVGVSQYMLYIMVPEPATASLSLLALAALVARRRRRA